MKIISITRVTNAGKRISDDDGVTFAAAVNIPVTGGGASAALVTDDQAVWIIGTVTGIARSSDSGATWSAVYVYDSISSTEDACFSPTDQNKMWVVGRRGRVYYSSDRGVTWNMIWEPTAGTTTNFARAIHMVSDTVGFMCGNLYSVDGQKNSVWKTTDGGDNWTILKDDFTYEPYDVFAVDANTVYLLEYTAAGHIWKSVDGGTNWTDKGIGSRTLVGGKIHAVGNSVWMTGKSTSVLEVMYSTDGGDNWTRVALSDPSSPPEPRAPITFISANVGYTGSLRFFKTTDGGQTWNFQGGYCGYLSSYPAYVLIANPAILSQFRSFNVSGSEPADRTSEGSAVSQSNPLNFGQMPKGQDSNVKAIIWRITNLGAYATISNMKFWAYDLTDFVGTNTYHSDHTDTWTIGKTPTQVKAGTPGTCPQTEPGAANLTKIGGGNITGVGHADTTQYVYLVDNIGSNETDGTKNFIYRVSFDYA